MKLIKKTDISKQVCYDLEVEDNHNFFANGILVHNSNAMVTLKANGEYGAGKRSSAISLDQPNEHFGFSGFVGANEEILTELINEIKTILGVDTDVVLYGEWAGGNVQKNVGVTGLPKFFYVFDLKVVNKDEDGKELNVYHNATEWFGKLPVDLVKRLIDSRTFFAPQVKTYTCDVDMSSPMSVTSELEKLTLDVEKECPVAYYVGGVENGVGEGIVWVHKKPDGTYYTMKIKGQQHSVSNVKKLVAVDSETINKMENFTEYACTENRMTQGIQEVYGSLEECTDRDGRIGKYINWVLSDIHKEEYDVLEKSKEFFDLGKVSGQIKNKATNFLFKVMDKNIIK